MPLLVNLESFDQIIKLYIKRQLKMKRFQSTSISYLSMMKALLSLFYFCSLSGPCCVAQVIWIHNYWSSFNLDQSIKEFKILPLSLRYFSVDSFLTSSLMVQQILLSHSTSNITKDTSQIIAIAVFIPCQFFSLFSVKCSYQEANRSSYDHYI